MTIQHRLLTAILTGYVLLAITYSVVSPLFEVSDELWHYPMVKTIADTGTLPVQNPQSPGLWRQEGSQPPLYYMIGAALTFWIDTSDLEQVRRVNPHSDIGVIRPDGNANMMVHRPQTEQFPWRGTALAVHIVRLFSVALGAGTVYITYRLGIALFPDAPTIGLTAAGLVAFLPMFLFIHGSVNNDALSNFLGNLITYLLVALLLRQAPPTVRDYLTLGMAMGAGLLAKGSIAFLIFLVAAVLLILAVRYRDWKILVVGGLISGGITNLIAVWWYIRNWQLYGDLTGLNAFLDTVGRRLIPANAQQLWAERHSFLQAYWGFFGGVNVAYPDWVYIAFNAIGAIALLSGFVYLLTLAVRRRQSWRWWLAALIPLVWMIVTFISYLQWTRITPASQGRLVFGALSSISLWMAVGLLMWLPSRRRAWLASGAVGYFALIGVITPFWILRPTYTPLPAPLTLPDSPLATFAPPNVNELGQIALMSARVENDTVRPSEYVHVTTTWQMLQATPRDWSLFVHLETPDGVIIAQRDVYPGGGLLATSDLVTGQAWVNPLAINVPSGAYAPLELSVWFGWYHLPSGERLQTADGERVQVGTVTLLPRQSTLGLPNPVRVNFANELVLLGYEYSTLTPQVGETMDVTLYWQALQPIPRDYVVFVHVIEPRTANRVGYSDSQPAAWTRPTTTWQVGEIITDTHSFSIAPDAPATPYELQIGLYTVEPDGNLPRLRIIEENGGISNDYFYLSRVRVIPND